MTWMNEIVPAPPARSGESPSLEVLSRVTKTNNAPGLQARLDLLKVWLKDGLDAVDVVLQSMIETPDDASLQEKVGAQILALPGKRIRPLCVLLAARLANKQTDPLVRDIAVAVELVHSATLLHDDVVDLGVERRGQTTARLVYGNAASILGGDFLLTRALRMIHTHKQPDILMSLLEVIEEMVAAEAIQLENRGNLVANPDTYLKVISGKTAALFRWALHAGGKAAGFDDTLCEHLAAFGHSLGMGFQLVDDLLDLVGDNNTLGKDLFADLAEGKMTYPLIVAAQRDPNVSASIQTFLESLAQGNAPERGDWVRDAVQSTGADAQTRQLARSYVEQAIQHLQHLPKGFERQALEAVAQAALARMK